MKAASSKVVAPLQAPAPHTFMKLSLEGRAVGWGQQTFVQWDCVEGWSPFPSPCPPSPVLPLLKASSEAPTTPSPTKALRALALALARPPQRANMEKELNCHWEARLQELTGLHQLHSKTVSPQPNPD